MIDTDALLQTLFQMFRASSALTTAFPGGCHIEVAPSNASGVYVVLEVATSPITHAYGNWSTANPTIIFKAVGSTRVATAAALKVWSDILDQSTTTISGVNSIARVGGAVPTYIGPDEASNANDLWQWAAAYEFATN